MTSAKPVTVKQLPERLVRGAADRFFQEVQPLLRVDRPRLVFDFSRVQQLDSSGIEILLRSMEEVMKRNGDVKLSAVPHTPAVVLEMTGVDRFFEIYESTSEAVQSFHQIPVRALERASRITTVTQPVLPEDELKVAS